MAGVRDPNGQVTAEQLNESVDCSLHNRGVNSSGFWDSFHGADNEEVSQQQQQHKQPKEQLEQRRAEQINIAKQQLEPSSGMVLAAFSKLGAKRAGPRM